jgi:hypothetical protein
VQPALELLEGRTTPAVLTVTSAADPHEGGLLTLREAIALANADASSGQSDTITFADSLDGATVTLTNGPLELTRASTNATVTVDGAGQITVSGNDSGGVFQVSGHVELDGLTITGGRVRDLGGGIYNGGTLTISDSTITGNTSGYSAGGIENQGTLIISRCTLAGNTALAGGGIENDAGTVTVLDSAFIDNAALGDSGGGIANVLGTVTVNDSTFVGNAALYSGGGISNYEGLVTVSNSSIVANSAAIDGGGGIATARAPFTVSNSIVAGNNAPAGPDIWGGVDGRSRYNVVGVVREPIGIQDGVNHNQLGTADQPIDPVLGPLEDNGGPTLTFALLPGSPALGAGGPSTMLVRPVDAAATSLPVDYTAGLAVNPGLIVQIDSEQLLITAVDTANNMFTVVRGANGTKATDHDPGADLFPASDQRGAPRVVDGSLDVGAYQSQPVNPPVALRNPEAIRIAAMSTFTAPRYDVGSPHNSLFPFPPRKKIEESWNRPYRAPHSMREGPKSPRPTQRARHDALQVGHCNAEVDPDGGIAV